LHYPKYLDPERYNWVDDSWAVAKYCPEKLVPEKYNWKDYSITVLEYCPEILETEELRHSHWKEICLANGKFYQNCIDEIEKNQYLNQMNIGKIILDMETKSQHLL